MAISPRRWLPLVIIAGIALYSFDHFNASHGEALEFIGQTIRRSSVVHRHVGEVQQVRLGIFDAYSEKYVGSDKWVKMTVSVVGSKASIKIKVAAQKIEGIWKVTTASIGGTQVSLN